MLALIRWGLVYGAPARSEVEASIQVWDLLALKAHFCADAAPDEPVTVYLSRDDLGAAVRVSRVGGFELTFTGSPPDGALAWDGTVGELADAASASTDALFGPFLSAFRGVAS